MDSYIIKQQAKSSSSLKYYQPVTSNIIQQ